MSRMSKYAPDKNLVGIYVLDEILTTSVIMEVRQLRYDIGQKGNDKSFGLSFLVTLASYQFVKTSISPTTNKC